jgi:protein O-mannosyl-transferase
MTATPGIPRTSVKHLAHKMRSYGKHPRFAFFLGAGASRQSGIITASEMIRYFKDRIFEEWSPDPPRTEDEKDAWLASQDWYQAEGSDYCKLFEKFEPKEIGRQRYIESIIEGQEPSFGYVVLANLMASNYVNTIVTTNFDDLVYGACTSYTGIRPIVYAYGVLASEMRITAERPKILKMHGDYLYSELKNTGAELAFQEPNMGRQVSQVLNEYGLVVVGYGGEDASVMKILSEISPKNDLYWCVMRGNTPTSAAQDLLSAKGGFLIEIDGFDEMMNEIRRVVGFDVGKMLGSIQERQDRMIDKLKNFDPQYSSDILSETVEALQRQASQEQEQIKKIQELDYFAKASKAHDAKDFEEAARLYRKTLELNPDDFAAHNNLGIVLDQNPMYAAEAEAAYRKALELEPLSAPVHNNLGFFLYDKRGNYAEAEEVLRTAVALDPTYSVAFNNLGNVLSEDPKKYDEAEVCYRKSIELNPKYGYPYRNLAQLLRVLGRLDEAVTLAEQWRTLEPDNPDVFITLAALLKILGREAESADYIAKGRELTADDDWYSRACLESISGRTEEAIEALKHAAEESSFDPDWVKRDPDLEWIRNDPRFSEIVKPKEESDRSPDTSQGTAPGPSKGGRPGSSQG